MNKKITGKVLDVLIKAFSFSEVEQVDEPIMEQNITHVEMPSNAKHDAQSCCQAQK